MTSITIPNSVTSIGNYAFSGCSSLTSINIPNPVTSIGDWAFEFCSSLTSITIPNSVTSIGYDAFYKCYFSSFVNISSLDAESNNYWGAKICNNDGLVIEDNIIVDCAKWATSINIPNSVTSIGNNAFDGCYGLTSITIPNSVTWIGYDAFDGFYFSSFVNNSSLDAESNNYWGAKICNNDGLVIEDNIIVDCAKWATSINIPNSVTSIGKSAFESCSGLTSITIPNSVTSIGENAFYGCTGLTSITIPNSVTSIRAGAFRGCTGLTSITIPNSVTSIGENAFYGCTGLTSITIPNSVTSIGNLAFYKCTSLTSITIPNSVTSIGERTFEYCSGLTSITILNSVISIGNLAFYKCTSLISITIPNSVTSIGERTFEYCSGLTSITIPNSVISIGNLAFHGCSGLTSITIPNSVTSIGEYVFSDCSGLISINVSWSRPLSISTDVFTYFDKTKCVLYVPKGTSTLYKSAPVWEYFQNIQEYEDEEFLANKKAFEEYKNAEKADAENLAKKGDSQAVLTLITNAKSDIDDLTYDEKITLEANKTKVDSIMTKLENDIKAQRIKEEEQLAADKAAFEIYKTTRKADAENLAKKGDSQAVLTLITNAKSAIDTLTYDESLSLDDNKKAVDAIITKLESDVKAQREAEELWANKLAFNTYRNSRKSDADALAKPDDSQEILAIITRAKEEIEGLEYDQSKSLSDNIAAVDAIIRQLKTDLENARIAAGMNGIITSDGNLQIHTLDGRKVDSIGKSGFYIINGVKKYVIGNCK